MLLQARALENQIFVIGPNKAGQEGTRVNIGRSFIASPVGGQLIAQAYGKSGTFSRMATIRAVS
jgi:predicted amidohydrolase